MYFLFFSDVLLFYFSGVGVNAYPTDFVQKQDLGLVVERPEMVQNLALIMQDKTLFPVSQIQLMLCRLHWGIKRKVLILDTRIATEEDEVG